MHQQTRTSVLALAVLGLALSVAPSARADAGGPWYAGAGIGPTIYVGCCNTHFRAEGEIGYHFGGHDTGFFLGANLTTSAGSDFIQFHGGVRLGGDIEVHSSHDFAILITPSGMLGGGLLDFDGGYWRDRGWDHSYGYFVLQPSLAVSIALVERLLHVWVRPVAFDFMFFPNHYDNTFGVDAIYSFTAGVFFTFG
jgi:hypothetical protein